MYEIRDCFVSRFGTEGLLVEVDFRQLEVCALAELSQDTTLIDELNGGEDIHTLNASMWLGKLPSAVTSTERKHAKVLTFQLQYGAKPPKMAETLGITEKAAAAFVDKFYSKYRGIKYYHEALIAGNNAAADSANKQQDPSTEVYVITCAITGRRYSIRARQSDRGLWYFSKTETKNYPVQGFATADIVPIVLNMILENLNKHESGFNTVVPINTVHDSFMFDCKAPAVYRLFDCVEMAFKDFPKKMEELFDYVLRVVYNYDVTIGSDWNKKHSTQISREDVVSILRGDSNE